MSPHRALQPIVQPNKINKKYIQTASKNEHGVIFTSCSFFVLEKS